MQHCGFAGTDVVDVFLLLHTANLGLFGFLLGACLALQTAFFLMFTVDAAYPHHEVVQTYHGEHRQHEQRQQRGSGPAGESHDEFIDVTAMVTTPVHGSVGADGDEADYQRNGDQHYQALNGEVYGLEPGLADQYLHGQGQEPYHYDQGAESETLVDKEFGESRAPFAAGVLCLEQHLTYRHTVDKALVLDACHEV